MFYATVTLRFDPAASAFDDAAFRSFSEGKELLSVREHFFEHGGLPHLLPCVTWRMPPAGSARPPTAAEDWRGLLTTLEATDRFDRIRRCRKLQFSEPRAVSDRRRACRACRSRWAGPSPKPIS